LLFSAPHQQSLPFALPLSSPSQFHSHTFSPPSTASSSSTSQPQSSSYTLRSYIDLRRFRAAASCFCFCTPLLLWFPSPSCLLHQNACSALFLHAFARLLLGHPIAERSCATPVPRALFSSTNPYPVPSRHHTAPAPAPVPPALPAHIHIHHRIPLCHSSAVHVVRFRPTDCSTRRCSPLWTDWLTCSISNSPTAAIGIGQPFLVGARMHRHWYSCTS